MEAENKKDRRGLVIIILVAIIAVAAVAIALILTNRGPDETVNIGDTDTPLLGYAEGVVAVEQDDLQAAVDAMFAKAKEGTFVTEYRNDAYSSDGETFACYVGNSSMNNYDLYIQIFADAELSDQLYLSGLLRPGTVFDEITLDHPLEDGIHRVYVIFTQVEEDLATLHGQITLTMDFHVGE